MAIQEEIYADASQVAIQEGIAASQWQLEQDDKERLMFAQKYTPLDLVNHMLDIYYDRIMLKT